MTDTGKTVYPLSYEMGNKNRTSTKTINDIMQNAVFSIHEHMRT